MAQATRGAASAARGRHFGALSLTEDRRGRLAQIWQQARVPQGIVIAIVGALLAAIWGWTPGYVAASFALLAIIDATLRLRSSSTRPPVAFAVHRYLWNIHQPRLHRHQSGGARYSVVLLDPGGISLAPPSVGRTRRDLRRSRVRGNHLGLASRRCSTTDGSSNLDCRHRCRDPLHHGVSRSRLRSDRHPERRVTSWRTARHRGSRPDPMLRCPARRQSRRP